MKKTLEEQKNRFNELTQKFNEKYVIIEGMELGPLVSNPFKSSSSTSTFVDNETPNSIPKEKDPNGYQGYRSNHVNKEFRNFLGDLLWKLRPQDREDGVGYSIYADSVAASLEKKYPKLKKII